MAVGFKHNFCVVTEALRDPEHGFIVMSYEKKLSSVNNLMLFFCLPAATFGTASMSMPAGFGTPASYSLPTSFSGNFQQPTFPTQAAFPQQTAFGQQPNGRCTSFR